MCAGRILWVGPTSRLNRHDSPAQTNHDSNHDTCNHNSTRVQHQPYSYNWFLKDELHSYWLPGWSVL